VTEILEETGLAPNALLLEITESIIVRDTQATLFRLKALKQLGVRLAIDDFGTGYSSFSFLQQFPLDVLKIDKSFVDDVTAPGPGAAVVRAIVELGRTLSLHTIAEGVEQLEQATALANMGCSAAQGFYFARPLHARHVDILLVSGDAHRSVSETIVPGLQLRTSRDTAPQSGSTQAA
jgi:EAL domain-containing protein (putative c-di-GMP-specific phosphodiesterase class I)